MSLKLNKLHGKQIYYSIKDPNLITVLQTLYNLYCGKAFETV